MATSLDNQQLKQTQTGLLPAANAWFQNPGMGYYPGQTSAGPTSMQQAGWNSMIGGGQMAQDFASGMGSSFNDMLNNPYMVDPSGVPQVGTNVIGAGPQVGTWQMGAGPQVASQQYGYGPNVQGQMISGLPQVSGEDYMVGAGQNVSADQVGAAPQVGLGGMNFFDNPYMQQSINNTLAANSKSFMENTLPQLDQGAIGAGQAGSSRHGLAQGSALTNLNQQNLDMASAMNTAMYESGKNSYLNQRGQDLGAQTTNAGNWLQSQLANQSANLQAAGMNQGDALSRALANQGVGMQGDLANQQNWLQMMMANQGVDMQGQLANQQNRLATNQMNLQGDLQSQLANQSNWFNVNQANQQAGQGSELANQQNWWNVNNANAANALAASGANAANWLGASQGNQDYMQAMAGIMPSMMGQYTGAMMAPGAAMANAGNQQWQIAQNQINGEMARWNYMRDQPYNRLNQYAGLIGSTNGMQLPGYNPPAGMDWGQAVGNMAPAIGAIPWGGTGGGGYQNNGGGDWFNPTGPIGWRG